MSSIPMLSREQEISGWLETKDDEGRCFWGQGQPAGSSLSSNAAAAVGSRWP